MRRAIFVCFSTSVFQDIVMLPRGGTDSRHVQVNLHMPRHLDFLMKETSPINREQTVHKIPDLCHVDVPAQPSLSLSFSSPSIVTSITALPPPRSPVPISAPSPCVSTSCLLAQLFSRCAISSATPSKSRSLSLKVKIKVQGPSANALKCSGPSRHFLRVPNRLFMLLHTALYVGGS